MGSIYKIIAGIGTLIAVYLVLSNANESVKIVNTIASNSIRGIQVLQGRESYMK